MCVCVCVSNCVLSRNLNNEAAWPELICSATARKRKVELVLNVKHFKRLLLKLPIAAAARSKAWVFGRSLAVTASSNRAGGMDVCLLRVLSVVR